MRFLRGCEPQRYYLDECVSIGREHPRVMTTTSAGMRGASDAAQLNYAFEHGRIFVTRDWEVERLAESVNHCGVIVLDVDDGRDEVIKALGL